MKAWEWKIEYLRQRQGCRCPIKEAFVDRVGGTGYPVALHHRIANTKTNRKAFPNLIDSILNLVAVSHEGHFYRGRWAALTIREAEARERFLERHPEWCRWANGEKEG